MGSEMCIRDSNVRARKLDVQLRNKFVAGRSKRVKLDCQQALYERYLNQNDM